MKQLVKMPGGMVRVTVEGRESRASWRWRKGEVSLLRSWNSGSGRGRSGHDSERGDAPDSEEKLEEYGKLNVAAGREVLSPLISTARSDRINEPDISPVPVEL